MSAHFKPSDPEEIDLSHLESADVSNSTFNVELYVKPLACVIDHKIPLSAEFYQEPYNYLRLAKIMAFQACFAKCEEFLAKSDDKKTKFLKYVERSCYNYAVKKAQEEAIHSLWEKELFQDLYNMTCCRILSNIDPMGIVKSKMLYKIIRGEIELDRVAYISSREMCPENYAEIDKKIETRKNVKFSTKTSQLYWCKKCGKAEAEITLMQTRSLDEGNTVFVKCVCGNSWQSH